jgi:hypothetical protein
MLASLYLPTLATPFDFVDDGCLVYPHGDRTLRQFLRRGWVTTVADYQEHGPFRPVLWAHLVAEAEGLHANALAWRAVHLAWAALAAGTLLWLLRELGMSRAAAVLAAALAMWNPYRGETWTNLTVTEGVAMPYALLALICAVRASRSSRPAPWDCAGVLLMLAALGCKNTFAAVVPAQLVLRTFPDGMALREGWRRNWLRAGGLALTLLLPAGHYLAYKLSWHAGQYVAVGASLAQLGRMLRTVRGALSYEFMTPSILLSGAALWMSYRVRGASGGGGWQQYRAACLAGLVLLACGVGIYLPIDGVAGRYAIPAAWGTDFLLAALLSALAVSPATRWRRAAFAAFGAGLVAVAVANLGKQDKFTARADLLWQTLEWVERQAPPGLCLTWYNGRELNPSEAVHFRHHLHARGRADVSLIVRDDADGRFDPAPGYAVCDRPQPPAGQWQLLREFRISYWGRLRGYRCYLFQGCPAPGAMP